MKKVLVVEENEGVRDLVEINMETLGFEVVMAPLSPAGVRECFFSHRQEVVCVISDGIINHDISGVGVVELIRSIDPEMPILALTADEAVAMNMMKVGATAFMIKPFNMNGFRHLIKTLIDTE